MIRVCCLHIILVQKGLFILGIYANENINLSPLCMVLQFKRLHFACYEEAYILFVWDHVSCILPKSSVKWNDRYESYGNIEQSLGMYCSYGNSCYKETKLYFWIVNCNNLILGSNIFYGQYQCIRIATIEHLSFWNWMTAWIRNTNFTQL